MTKNKSIKLCRICGEYEGTAVKGKVITFEKHRNVCRICRNKYHKNRREDLLDGVRNDSDWYTSEEKIQKVRKVKTNGGRKDTCVNQLYDRELRHEYVDGSAVNRQIFLGFLFAVIAITYFLFYV